MFESKDQKPKFRLDLGSNSIVLLLVLSIFVTISYKADVLNWDYLKGLNNDLSFFICMCSIIFGAGFYSYWNLGNKSVYSIHLVKTKFLPTDVNVIFSYRDFSFGISSHYKTGTIELPSTIRQILCIGVVFNLAIVTMDNAKFDKLVKFPSEIFRSKSDYCPDTEKLIEVSTPIEGCELIVRAFKLGYAKDLGICEPKKVNPSEMKICQHRRIGEPFLHYKYRQLLSSIHNKYEYFKNNKLQNVVGKFDLQLQNLENLGDYQTYAINASPRASHHIWTNLPYPNNYFMQKYREIFRPNYCIEQFHNQTNTIKVQEDDQRKYSKLLEHAYGRLLFSPKSAITVGFCKEYEIHWNSDPDICKKLSTDPRSILQEQRILSDVELVLRRHDIANEILNLEEDIQEIEKNRYNPLVANTDVSTSDVENKSRKIKKKIIVKSKIAKNRQQIRRKNELVSFQCLMQKNASGNKNAEHIIKLSDTNFTVRTRYFPELKEKGDSQIAMYNELSKVLENRFHYSKLISRSDINIESNKISKPDVELLKRPTYLFSRLEVLKNVDIFLGNNWVLERDDLLDVYPYHVHMKNYVDSFRALYYQSRGRL